ncbi:thiamine diphosphokinase [Maritalea mediterranea]|uniref:Thiamine diphosphokinase n=1 Tax=Maritalea mediterranea TaxID=2909667 RepID=A0ABS9EA10_9HYPH|nr:thiamine diphosphokinase [Maritalea mediterranea]MCF4099711.1 thiamine diphosphokinase [Maritalea mediterranea]
MASGNEVLPDLTFNTPLVVLGGGFVDEAVLLQLVARGYPVVAADGAAHTAIAAKVPLAAIIGDMDSYVADAALSEETLLVEVTEQATTDFEKCLYKTDAPLYICLGMIGKRFDHSLAALHAAQKYGSEKHLILMDETDVIGVVRGEVSFRLPVGTRVSIYPLSPIQMRQSAGLHYPLDGLTLAQGTLIGTSNCATHEQVKIVPDNGEYSPYLVILPNRYLDSLIEIEMNDVSATSL